LRVGGGLLEREGVAASAAELVDTVGPGASGALFLVGGPGLGEWCGPWSPGGCALADSRTGPGGVNQPRGVSGPQFLWIYGAGLAALVAAPGLLALLARAFSAASPRVSAPVLDAYEVGYLAGGAQRAAEVIIGELTASGALRVDSAGQISQAGPAQLAAWYATCPHRIAAQAIPDGLRAQKVRQRLAKDPAIVAIGVRLRAERPLIARSWIIAVWVTALTLWAALMIGSGRQRNCSPQRQNGRSRAGERQRPSP
jgi:hypothetical protein